MKKKIKKPKRKAVKMAKEIKKEIKKEKPVEEKKDTNEIGEPFVNEALKPEEK